MATVNYKLIKNFFTKEEVKLFQIYCYRQLDLNKDYKIDEQSFSPSFNIDPLTHALLELKTPLVEKESGLNLFPSYTYWRYYIFGAHLAKHTDRPACEVSVTVCVKKYDKWPLVIEGDSYELEEGDGLLYAGCVHEHWRPGIYKGEGLAQIFFHYVDKNGPFTHHAYDQYCLTHNGRQSKEDQKIMNELKLKFKKEIKTKND